VVDIAHSLHINLKHKLKNNFRDGCELKIKKVESVLTCPELMMPDSIALKKENVLRMAKKIKMSLTYNI
jgi:hypothetical protein